MVIEICPLAATRQLPEGGQPSHQNVTV